MALASDRLADAGHVLDQQVALAEQGDEREPHLVVLADDDALDVGDDLLADFLRSVATSPQSSRVRTVCVAPLPVWAR